MAEWKILSAHLLELKALGGLDPPPKPTGNPWCGSIRESSHANILCSVCLCWRVCKQDGGGQVLFLMGCQLPLYTSLWIIGIPQETLWELGTLSLTRWTRHSRKKPWKNHWIAPSPTRDGWSQPAPCSHDLRLQAQVYTFTLTSRTQPTSWF